MCPLGYRKTPYGSIQFWFGSVVAISIVAASTASDPRLVSGTFPSDALRMPFVGDWHYYSRPRGMQTSSDDVLVAAVASYPHLFFDDEDTPACVERYCDLGCGIGSSLLLVAHNSRPAYSLGVEVQEVSYQMVSRAVRELPVSDASARLPPLPRIELTHGDLRSLPPHLEPFDLITANPPYLPPSSGTHPADAQRSMARFEQHGGVEDYCRAAQSMLSPSGRFVLAFWHRMRDRVERASKQSGLHVARRLDVTGGRHGATTPHLSIWELRFTPVPPGSSLTPARPVAHATLDITRTAAGSLNPAYKNICATLQMRPRPLQPLLNSRTGI